MRVRVKMFAVLAARTGASDMVLELPEGATVAAALDVLSERHRDVAALRDRLATAVDMAYVGPGHVLSDGAELALIPPVSGG